MAETPVPLVPRITKSTAVAAIIARFPDTEALLQRFEVAKNQANLWDGERDGIREAVKKLEGGMYGRTVLSWTTSAAVMYPNAEGKHQIENCLQTTIERPVFRRKPEDTEGMIAGDPIVVFRAEAPDGGSISAALFLDQILHELQKGKSEALAMLERSFLGSGRIVDNTDLYEKKGNEKSSITVMPEV